MERWRSFLLLFLAVVVIGAFIWHTWREHEKKRREAAYQRILQGYDEALKPGMTRKGVEDYLLDTGAKFTHICCIDERSTFADITKVGESTHHGSAASTTFTSPFNSLLIRREVA
jgi:cbb3-type cytochrome oxidase subunit 3